ncbi:hypothetical protein QW71_24225 [Paenibacillus sp. IHB B 3415]|nr:hypothetical protein QW71_24225 [Paenibacillus sp. IHB B 3415]
MNYLYKLRDYLDGKNENSIEYIMYKKELSRILESHLKEYNPERIIDNYVEFLSEKKFSKKIIKKGEIFLRGRIGSFSISGSKGTFNTKFVLPYYGKMIEAAPNLYIRWKI